MDGQLLEWTGREQFVQIEDYISNSVSISFRVPQGLMIGPLTLNIILYILLIGKGNLIVPPINMLMIQPYNASGIFPPSSPRLKQQLMQNM